MAKSKITGIELPEKASVLSESYVKCAGQGMSPVPGTDADGVKGKCPQCPAMIELRGSCGHVHDAACGRLCAHEHTATCGTACGHKCSHKCGKRCTESCAHSHTDTCGKGCKHTCGHVCDTECTQVVMVAHLAGGKTPPLSAGTKGVRTAHPSRSYGEAVSFRGNTPCDVGDVPPVITGPDQDGSMPRPKMHKGREVPTNGTNAGGLGRPRVYMNPSTNLVGPQVPGLRGERDPRITEGEFAKLSRKHKQRYTKKIHDMRRAAVAANKRRKEFEAEHGTVLDSSASASRRHTDEPSRPSGEIPTGTRVSVEWDSAHGGRFVDTMGRRAGEKSVLAGIRTDEKPNHGKYKSEPIFGRTVRRSA